MIFKMILIKCPFEGLFCKHVTTFIGDSEFEIEQQMLSHVTTEYDNCRSFLADSSAYNEKEFEDILEAGEGFNALIELAKKWGWEVFVTEGEVDE